MGLLDKFRKKKQDSAEGQDGKDNDKQSKPQPASGNSSQPASSSTNVRRIKKYTSDGKPVYEQ